MVFDRNYIICYCFSVRTCKMFPCFGASVFSTLYRVEVCFTSVMSSTGSYTEDEPIKWEPE